ncbi:MAG: translocation/assembly module TamB domain-containing protein, partial [Elainellaceae cyanobacterium]
LLEQLVYATKLAALTKQMEENRTVAVVPSLEELGGSFDATVTASGQVASGLDGLEATFALNGEDWQWGQYDSPNQVEVAGRLDNGTLALQPARFESGDSSVAYTGTVGLGPQSGELRIEQVPVPLLQDFAASFVAVPVELGGTLSAVTTLEGSLEAPVVEGIVAIANAEINGEPLEELAAEFRYADALFTAESRLVNQGPEKLVAEARIPYALPFMAVQPTSDQISIEAIVQDEGLALISAVTDGQLQWKGGNGIVRVDVTGTLEAPDVAGTAQFDAGILAIAAIDDPVTDLTGRAAFNLQQVQVAGVTAKHNGGNIQIQGGLPLSNPALGRPSQLQVDLDQVPIDLDVDTSVDVAFSAVVDGDVHVTGTALRPILGGTIQLADGRVDPIRGFIGGLGLLGGNRDDKAAPVPESVGEDRPPQRDIAGLEQFGRVLEQTTVDNDSFAGRIGFNDLRLILANDLAIAGQPFFNIKAAGNLVVNGTLAALRPDGQLMLKSGWVNIYTTQFRLDRGETNQVILDPERGLDPILIATATASVPETEQNPIPPSSPFMSSEVADQSTVPSFGGFETVEVTARIDGPLSQLSDNLKLESQPARSSDQLVALIGGGLVNQLARGDTALALASYVGSGTLASFSNDIVDTLGLDLFRIFPTTDVGDDSNLPINIGVEAGVDLTQNLSFTVLQLIGSTTPPQFGVRYRLTDDLQIRANTDLNEDTRSVLEYQIRF